MGGEGGNGRRREREGGGRVGVGGCGWVEGGLKEG